MRHPSDWQIKQSVTSPNAEAMMPKTRILSHLQEHRGPYQSGRNESHRGHCPWCQKKLRVVGNYLYPSFFLPPSHLCLTFMGTTRKQKEINCSMGMRLAKEEWEWMWAVIWNQNGISQAHMPQKKEDTLSSAGKSPTFGTRAFDYDL